MEEIKPGFTRVTTPLSIYNKFDAIDPTVLQNAAERGSRVHKYCEMYAKGEYLPEPEKEISLYLESFREWHDSMVEEVISTEQRFYDDTLMLTGQIDLIATVRGDKLPAIIDIKTAQTKSKTWPLQLAAYKHLSEIGIDPRVKTRRIALQLRKDGMRAKVVEYTNYAVELKIYLGILEAWRFFS